MKLGCNYHKGRAAIRHYANQTVPYDLCVADPISRWETVGSTCLNSVLNVKAVVAAFNQEKALVVGAFSVITNLRMELFQALLGMLTMKSGITTHGGEICYSLYKSFLWETSITACLIRTLPNDPAIKQFTLMSVILKQKCFLILFVSNFGD